MVLRDVRYVIDAHFEMTDHAAPGDNPGKFQDIIKRRLERGQFYSMPYLGTREFAAHFQRCAELPPCPEELRGTQSLGWMLWDMDYSDPKNITPHFFRAVLTDGVLHVPQPGSEEVTRMILQALTRCYEDLLQRGEIAAPGWSPAKISFALCLDADGRLTQVIPHDAGNPDRQENGAAAAKHHAACGGQNDQRSQFKFSVGKLWLPAGNQTRRGSLAQPEVL